MNRLLTTPEDHMPSSATREVQAQSSPPPPDDLGFVVPGPMRLGPARAIGIAVALLLAGACAFLIRWIPRQQARHALETSVASPAANAPRVQVTKPKLKASTSAVVLPGSVQPLQETIIYPRASGYVRKWNYDLGDHVKAGAELALIDTPELDQQLKQAQAQLAQARASLLQAKANREFSTADLKRFEQLTPAGVASQQELEKGRAQAQVDEANVSVAEANIDARRASIEQIAQLKSFARVLAPFDGIVTARSIELGTLVTAGNSSPLFKITQPDPARIFIQVPQNLAPTIATGLKASLTIREFPNRKFVGSVTRAAGALDNATRTMTTEIRVPNPAGELLAGMYAEVSLDIPTPHQSYELPATALLNDASGTRVAVVTDEQSIHLVPVVLERDNGPTIDIAAGLDGTERVVRLVSADLTEHLNVSVVP